MAAITKIEFWSDVGFVDGAVEIPRLHAPDPTDPDVTIEPDEPILPSKDRFFSEVKLKEYYTGLLTMSYMRVTYDLKNSLGVDTPNVFYGWVDSVKLSSDGEIPMTVISWHIDEWRTWKSAVSFGSGHVKRRPFRDLATTPIQNYNYRYLELPSDHASTRIELAPKKTVTISGTEYEIWWVVFSYNVTGGGNTTIQYGFFPVTRLKESNFDDAVHLYVRFNSTVNHVCLTLREILTGQFDEKLGGIPPTTINGIWLSPICPTTKTVTGTGTAADPLIFSGLWEDIDGIAYDSNVDYGAIGCGQNANMVNYSSYTVTINLGITSSEQEYYVIPSFDGTKNIDIPYGMTITSVEMTFILEATSAYIQISLRDSLLGRLEGCTTNLMLPILPYNENAYSEYVYSGQQYYDRSMRTTQSNANAWKNSINGASQGAMMGAFGPQGFGLGVIGGLVGGLGSYGVEMLYQNDEEQNLMNGLMASQTSGMLASDIFVMAAVKFPGPVIEKLKPDNYSSSQITATRNQFGISVDELMSSCDLLLRNTSPTGYYNIQNLIVNGNIPVSAKRWIREKFRSGVRLI